MSTLSTQQGTCLCGKIQIVANTVSSSVGACHCQMCRTWAGGPLMAVDCGTDVRLKGEDCLSIFPSSDWAERGFCKHCGTHLFYRLKDSQQYFVPAGLFGQGEGWMLKHQLFIDQKPDYFSFANQTHDMTGAEFLAQFAADTNS